MIKMADTKKFWIEVRSGVPVAEAADALRKFADYLEGKEGCEMYTQNSQGETLLWSSTGWMVAKKFNADTYTR